MRTKTISPFAATFISTYVPRKCGIATYTRDLIEVVQKQCAVSVVAIHSKEEDLHYPPVVEDIIEKQQQEDYVRIAEKINKSATDIVHIQHEFGIFGGEDGEYILDFARMLAKPFVVTFHTILKTPSQKQMAIMKELTRLSRGVITMKEIGKDRLIHTYGINGRDISVIFHGVPDMDHLKRQVEKKKFGFEEKQVLMTSNLLSSNKGVEYVISAMPEVIKKIPNALLLIIGETHPEVKKQEGEVYREKLEKLVSTLHLAHHVQFVNQYVSLEELKEYFALADIVITPYLEAEQITSGTLAYAIGAGKVCISTPYIYAKNMLKNNRGILVPFTDAQAIAEEVVGILTHPDRKHLLEKRAYAFGQNMRWPRIAIQHVILYRSIIKKEQSKKTMVIQYTSQPVDLSYLQALTDSVGVLQHSRELLPNNKMGYATDDNARALLAVASLYKKNATHDMTVLVKKYLSFLSFAQEENGAFHTFLGPDSTWLDNEDNADAYGRSVWALGFFLYTCPRSPFGPAADKMFRRALTRVSSIRDVKTAAYTMLGLYYYYRAFEDEKDSAMQSYTALVMLADFLVQEYKKEQQGQWHWFERVASYDNFRLPQALFLAFLATKKQEYKTVAEKTLTFLLEWNYDEKKDCFDFIGQDGWLEKGKTKALFDQQSLEPAGAVRALLLAYSVTRKKMYKEKALKAFAWFLGDNRNHVSMIDVLTKGVYDGLTSIGVNENEGSESIICFLLAHIAIKEAFTKD